MRILRILTGILFATASLMMASCDPEEVFYIDPELLENPISDVQRTTWINETSDSYEDENGIIHVSVESDIIKFKTETSGLITHKYVTDTQNEEVSYPFSYTYATPNGTITISEDGNSETFNFTCNVPNTLTLYLGESDSIMFSRLRE